MPTISYFYGIAIQMYLARSRAAALSCLYAEHEGRYPSKGGSDSQATCRGRSAASWRSGPTPHRSGTDGELGTMSRGQMPQRSPLRSADRGARMLDTITDLSMVAPYDPVTRNGSRMARTASSRLCRSMMDERRRDFEPLCAILNSSRGSFSMYGVPDLAELDYSSMCPRSRRSGWRWRTPKRSYPAAGSAMKLGLVACSP